MPETLTTLLSAPSALSSSLFWVLLAVLLSGLVWPERILEAQPFKKSFFALLAIIATKGLAGMAHGFLALMMGLFWKIDRGEEVAQVMTISLGLQSFLAGISWIALVYGFWQAFLAHAPATSSRRARRAKEELAEAKASPQP